MMPEYTTFSRDLDNLFVESGRRAHVIWRLDGSYGGLRAVSREIVNPPGGGTEGIWAEPLRLADAVHFHIWNRAHGLESVERNAKRYTRHVGWSEIHYLFGRHPEVEAAKKVWVPREAPAVVTELEVRNTTDRPQTLAVFVVFHSHLSVGWPLREGGRNLATLDADLPGVVATEESHPWAAVCATSLGVTQAYLGCYEDGMIRDGRLPRRRGGTTRPSSGRSCLRHELTVAPGGSERLVVVVAGSVNGVAEARSTARDVLGRADELLEERKRHYEKVFRGTTLLSTPSYVMDKAFLWAKVGTEDFKHDDPRLGFLFFAGYPAYNFFFASDTMLILRGSLAIGDFEDARRMLRTIVRYQATTKGRDTQPGEIWHEMSTSGDRISPNFAGFLFPGLLHAFWRWTGDRAFLEEMYPHARAVVEWGYGMDTNGDGLLENGPEGEMADSAHEDRNVERSHFGVQTQWLGALAEGQALALLVGDGASEARWRATFDALRPVVNRLYWNERERYFEETLRPDGSLDTSGKGLACLDTTLVDEGKTVLTTRLHLDEEAYLTDVRAFRERQAFEKTFSTHRSYMSWYVIERGRRARELYHAHLPDVAFRALEDIAGSPFHWTTPGLWPEVWAVDEPSTLRARGCFHQAWTGSFGYIHPVVDGLFGLVPDALRRELALEPHLPPHWPRAALERVRIGEGTVDLVCEQADGHRRLTVRNHGDNGLGVVLGFVLPSGARVQRLVVNGQEADPAGAEVIPTSRDIHVRVRAVAGARGEGAAELWWVPSVLALEPSEPRVLERATPGEAITVVVRVRSRTRRVEHCRLAVDLPEGWTPPARETLGREVGPDETVEVPLQLRVPSDAAEGHYTIRVRLDGPPGELAAVTVYVPVFAPIDAALDAREVAREGVAYRLDVRLSNLGARRTVSPADVVWPADFQPQVGAPVDVELGPGETRLVSHFAVPAGSGERVVAVRAGGRELSHPVRVVGRGTPLIVYTGFLACPLETGVDGVVVNMPANYALRKPHVLTQHLAHADLLLTTDQHDGVFSQEQTREIAAWVHGGGRLFLYCAWSAPWGRGFHETFGSVSVGAIPDLLPLEMGREILSARAVRITPEGKQVLGGIPWDTVPPYDHNAASLRPGATMLAATEGGEPLAAWWKVGRGRVAAVAIDCFGFESYVEGLSFDFWPGRVPLIRAVARHVLEATS